MKNYPAMIPRTASRWQTRDWQNALKHQHKTLESLLDACEIKADSLDLQLDAHRDFPIKVTQHYVNQIEKGNPKDPLLLQVLPNAAEVTPKTPEHAPIFVEDPLKEKIFNNVPGLIHKYHGRVLLISNPSCAIHCRYCFRRHFAYDENTPSTEAWADAITYIEQDPSIHEVILSGGDPLSSNDQHLEKLLQRIDAIKHVTTIRFHTRIPVVMPERITNELMTVLNNLNAKIVMVLHINHANEISNDVIEACGLLQQQGTRLLNQSVLLKHINHSQTTLNQLFIKLHQLDIQAYYLHLLDPVKGAAHFWVSDSEAIQLYQQLQSQLPGYMLPKLVRETANQPNKSTINIL